MIFNFIKILKKGGIVFTNGGFSTMPESALPENAPGALFIKMHNNYD